MKTINKKYKMPITMLIMLPLMLFLLPACRLWYVTPKGISIYPMWLETIKSTVPSTLLFFVIFFTITNIIINRIFIFK
jgi:hypothetical protein